MASAVRPYARGVAHIADPSAVSGPQGLPREVTRFHDVLDRPVVQPSPRAMPSTQLPYFVHDVLTETKKRGAPLTVREIAARVYTGGEAPDAEQELVLLGTLQATGLP